MMSGAFRRISRDLVNRRNDHCFVWAQPISSSSAAAASSSTNEIPFYGLPRSPKKDTRTSSLSFLQRVGLAVQSATTAFADPTRADAVASLGEVTGYVALTGMREKMMSDPVGRLILLDRPVVNKDSLPIEKIMASGSTSGDATFGQAYGSFLKEHGFDPDERDAVKYIEDEELAYIMLRYRQCHDFWHALTGLPPTVLGELGLKWLELLQTGLPVAALSATVGSLRLNSEERQILHELYIPWAVRMSKESEYLMNVYYEKEMDTPLGKLREKLRIEPAPEQ